MATSDEFIKRFRSLIATGTTTAARTAADELWSFIHDPSPGRERVDRYNKVRSTLASVVDSSSSSYSPLFTSVVAERGLYDDLNTLYLASANMVGSAADRKFKPQTATLSQPSAPMGSTSAGADRVLRQRTPSTTSSTSSSGGSSSGRSTSGGGGGGGSTSTGGGGGGGGSTPTGGGDGPSDRLPGGYEVWKIGKDLHLVWTLPGSTTPMAWRVDGNPDVILGSYKVQRTLDRKGAAKAGVLVMGRHSDLKNTEKDPFDNFLDVIEERSRTEPWLLDPEVIVQSAEAYLEGREVTLNDLAETNWYNSQTDKERAWVKFAAQASDAEVQQATKDRELAVRDMLLKAGVSDPPPQLVDYLTRQDLTGKFSDAEFAQQITAIADPYSGIELDKGVQAALKGIDLVTKASDVRAMRERVQKWLGPFADNYSDAQLAEWSGMVRNDPNGDRKLDDILKGQRMALLPEYDNPDVKWADAAAPWKSFISQQWGETIDDSDPLLLNVVRANDINEAGRMLRREGVKRGVGGAVNDLTDALGRAFGSNVRRSL